MTWLRWFRDRQLATGCALLRALPLPLQQLRRWTTPETGPRDFVGPPRSGYTLTDFRLSSYDRDGLPAFTMQAPHLERREGDESLYINAPRFALPSNQPGVPDWHGQSLYGWVSKDGDLLKLLDPV